MNKKEQQMQRERQEDVVLNKVLWWIVGAVVLEFLLLLLNRFYSYYTPDGIALAQALRTVFTVLGIVLPLCFLALLAWYRSARRSGKGTRLSGALTLIALALAVCAVVIAVFRASGIQFLYIAVPAVAVLALIYYLYQHEFFLIAVLSALGILAVHLVPRADLSALIAYGYAVALAVILAAALLFSRKLQTSGGILKLGGTELRLFPKNANYAMLYVTCIVVAAVLVAALLLGSLPVLYGVMVAWLLIMAVYYTVRLM